jgi:hypothetical protein
LSIYRGAGGSGDATADSSSEALLIRELAVEVQADADAAQASATAASTSASNASTSASAASTSATNASNSATSASSSASSATSSASSASTSATNASNSATAAQTAETNAETAETNAETAETNAAASASAASTSATNASNSASAASTSATNASNSASAASTSASNASTSATSASSSASSATTSASNASTSATNASNSATSASTSATTATTQAGIATTQASNAATSATNAQTAETNAETAETNAAASASAASTSASNASTSSSNASTSASNAATSATNAANSATLAASYTPSQTGNAGKYLTTDGTNTSWGTVTSGGVTSVTGTSPVVSSGGATPAISLASGYGDTQNPYASKTENFVLAAPNGTAGAPTFRAVVAADIPTLNQNTTGTASNVTGTVAVVNGGTGLTAVGTTGNVLTSNGSTWVSSTPSGGGFSGATVNAVGSSAITLTSSSTQYQVTQINSVANSTVNLPNATTLSAKGFAPYVIENRNPIGTNLSIKDSAGLIVGYIPVGYIGLVSLADNSTSAGSWDVEQVQPQTFFNWDTASYSSNTQTGDSYLGMVGLSSTTFVRFRQSNVGGVTTFYSQACTISGSTITFGATVNFNFGGNTNSNIRSFQALRLSNTAYVLKIGVIRSQCCTDTALVNFRTCTVSGTTITQGSSSNGGLPQSTGGNGSIAGSTNGIITRLSDTTFALVYNTAATDSYATPYNYSGSLACQIVSVSGTTQTVGTAVNLGSSTYSQPTSIIGVSSSVVFVAYAQSASAGATTGRTKMNVVSVSGTTPTWGTSVSIESADTPVFLNNWAMFNGAVAPSSSQVVFNIGYGVAEGTISGTTPTYDSTPSGSVIYPLFLATSTKAYGTGGQYLNIQTGGFVLTTNGINTIQIGTPSAIPQTPLGAQPTTSYVGIINGNPYIVMLGNTL